MSFVSQELLNEKFVEIYKTQEINNVIPMAPFVSKKIINDVIKRALENDNLNDLRVLMPFSENIHDIINLIKK